MPSSPLLDIGEVRSRSGFPASTLHFYERRGLIRSVSRSGLRRQYEPETIDRLAVIVMCQQAGFRLDEISALLSTGGELSWKELAAAKLEEIRAQLAALEQMELALTHALKCPSDNVLRCEHFRAELDAVLPVVPAL
jgi:DNA-binding transcriptional MerR regulator